MALLLSLRRAYGYSGFHLGLMGGAVCAAASLLHTQPTYATPKDQHQQPSSSQRLAAVKKDMQKQTKNQLIDELLKLKAELANKDKGWRWCLHQSQRTSSLRSEL
jgi:hypothetical protein